MCGAVARNVRVPVAEDPSGKGSLHDRTTQTRHAQTIRGRHRQGRTPRRGADQAPDFGYRFRRLQGGRPDGAQGRGDRHGEGRPGDGTAFERRIARLGSRNIAGADPPRIRPHGNTARQGRRLGRGVRTGAHRPPESRGGTAERQGEPGDRQKRHHQPLQGAQQHADPIDDRRYDPRRADQGRKLGDPGQHVQRRYDHRLRSRHVEHALPGQRRRNGRRQVARRHARETDDRRPAERRTGCQPGVRFAQSDRG